MGFIAFGVVLAVVQIGLAFLVPFTIIYALGFAWVVYSWWLEENSRYGNYEESHRAKRVGLWARAAATVGALITVFGQAFLGETAYLWIIWLAITFIWAFTTYAQYQAVQISKTNKNQYKKWSRF